MASVDKLDREKAVFSFTINFFTYRKGTNVQKHPLFKVWQSAIRSNQ